MGKRRVLRRRGKGEGEGKRKLKRRGGRQNEIKRMKYTGEKRRKRRWGKIGY